MKRNNIMLMFCLMSIWAAGGCSKETANSSSVPSDSSKAAATSSASQPATMASRKLTAEEAQCLVLALPEVKAWDGFIGQRTKNKVHGAVMTDADGPESIDGRTYWPVVFGENGPGAFHRWETFEVDAATGEVMVADGDGEKLLPLDQWRKDRNPMGRIGR